MYCIFHLPRTGSHYLHSAINSSLSFLDPRHIGTNLEPFNPAFNTDNEIWEKYNKFIDNDPPTTVKMVINHYPKLADKFLENEKYKTVFIKPQNYRRRLLKALVEKHLGTYSNGTDRKSSREKHVGTLSFSDDLVIERFDHYKIHMEYESLCDYVFYDEVIFYNLPHIMKQLELPLVIPRYKRVAPYYTDGEMLNNIDEFNEQYDNISIKMFGKVI